MESHQDATAIQPPAIAGAVPTRQPGDTAPAKPRRKRRPQRKTRAGKARLLTFNVLDARTAAYADARRLVETLSTDLGGDDQLSEGERQLVTRAALVGAIVSDFETRWVTGESVRLSDYLSACNVQRRILATLGLKRQAKTVGSTLGDRQREFHERQRQLEREKRAAAAAEAAAAARAKNAPAGSPLAANQEAT